jgi:hypothetical protein
MIDWRTEVRSYQFGRVDGERVNKYVRLFFRHEMEAFQTLPRLQAIVVRLCRLPGAGMAEF